MNISFKSAQPHLIAIAAFCLITIAYFFPAFQGKAIRQSDMMNARGMAKEVVDYREKTGEEPLWTNSMFSGMPAYQVSMTSPGNLIKPITNFFVAIFSAGGAIIFLCMLGFYLLLLVMRQSPFVSALGAIAFGLSSYFVIIIEAGHVTKGFAIAYMAPVVAGILLTYRGKYLLGGVLTLFALALQLTSNHLQITYYLLYIVLFIGIAKLISAIMENKLGQFAKATGVLIVASILAIGPGATTILSTYEYGKESTRGKSELTADAGNKTSGLDKDYATQWSYGVGETFTLMIPNYKGGGSGAIAKADKDALKEVSPQYQQYIGQMDAYWGDQPFTSGPVYVGAIVVFLFVLGLFVIKGPLKWALLGVTVLSILLGWGKNLMGFTEFFLDHVPGYNKFRAVSMILVIAEFTIPLIAFLALGKIMENPGTLKKSKTPFWVALGVTAGLCLLFLVAPTMFQDFYKAGELTDLDQQLRAAQFPDDQAVAFIKDLQEARMEIFKGDVLRTLFFILAGAALLYLYIADKIKRSVVLAVMGLLILIDLWAVDKRYLSKESYVDKQQMERPFSPSTADNAILQDKTHYRVLNLAANTFNDASTSYFHKSIGGYHGAKMKRYQEIIDAYLAPGIQEIISTLRSAPTDSSIRAALGKQDVMNMVNTKYIIYNPDASPLVNDAAFGNAWFVDEYKIVQNADEEIAALGKTDLENVAVVDKRFADELSGLNIAPDPTATIELTSYAPNKLTYKTNAKTDQLAVFSEVYYQHGWNAFVDGKPVPHVRANYILRAMKVPAGEHTIEFKFEPKIYSTGETIALVSSLIIILLVVFTIVKELGMLPSKNKPAKVQ